MYLKKYLLCLMEMFHHLNFLIGVVKIIVITTNIFLHIFHLWCGNIFRSYTAIGAKHFQTRVEVIGAKYIHTRNESFRPCQAGPSRVLLTNSVAIFVCIPVGLRVERLSGNQKIDSLNPA